MSVGICNTGGKAAVASFGPHFGEKDPLTGTMGSGANFFFKLQPEMHVLPKLYLCSLWKGGRVIDIYAGYEI